MREELSYERKLKSAKQLLFEYRYHLKNIGQEKALKSLGYGGGLCSIPDAFDRSVQLRLVKRCKKQFPDKICVYNDDPTAIVECIIDSTRLSNMLGEYIKIQRVRVFCNGGDRFYVGKNLTPGSIITDLDDNMNPRIVTKRQCYRAEKSLEKYQGMVWQYRRDGWSEF